MFAFLALAFVSANGTDDEVSFYAGIVPRRACCCFLIWTRLVANNNKKKYKKSTLKTYGLIIFIPN